MDAVSMSEGRQQLFKLREQVVENQEQIILTHKRGNVVLISMDEWNAYQETARLLRDRETMRALLQSFDDHDAGREVGKSVAEVFMDIHEADTTETGPSS